jgi:NAD(P)H-dependent FMN reductase
MVKIAIVTGSTRPGRFGEQPSRWLFDLAQKQGGAEFQLVDLEEQGLPLLDEPVPPAQHKYQHEHTKRWARLVDSLDGFVFVTAEYNHSIPAALKNALDYVWYEWHHKPAAFVSYGSAAGGARSVAHLRGVMGELKIYDLRDQLLMPEYWNRLDDEGRYQFSDREVEAAQDILRQIVFWAEEMKRSRERLAQESEEQAA